MVKKESSATLSQYVVQECYVNSCIYAKQFLTPWCAVAFFSGSLHRFREKVELKAQVASPLLDVYIWKIAHDDPKKGW